MLIVEAQYLVALDLQHTLDQLGPGKVVIALNPGHARELAKDWVNCDLAIVEVERELPEHIALIGELLRKGIPVIGLTADSGLQRHLNWFAGTPILLKPAPSERTLAVLASLFASQKE
ncbi:hypothetical protein ASD83_09585 [Devosia sp. Root685]|nr:hypothetical protein ASD83_09585 [Devosia sp. Root685]